MFFVASWFDFSLLNDYEKDMNTKRFIYIAVIVVLLAGCMPARFESGVTPMPSPTGVSTPTPAQTGVTILADGVVQAAQPALPLAFEAAGKLLEVRVQAGDRVKKGDVVARLDGDASLDSYQAAVTSAELSVLKAQQALDELYANAEIARTKALNDIAVYAQAVRDAQFQLENYTLPTYLQGLDIIEALNLMKQRLDAASKAFEPYRYYNANDSTRQQRLIALNEAQSQYDAAVKHLNYEYDLQAAQANLDKALKDYDKYTSGPAPDDLILAKAEADNAQAQLTLAQNNLKKAITGATLTAPVDGIVLSVEAASGALVGNGSPILTLLDTTQLEFHTTNLSERDLAMIYAGQTAVVTLKAYPDHPIQAKVARIGWQAGAAVGDATTFPIMLVLDAADLDIRPGMTGRAEIRSN